jgi:hypothetical protein
MIMMIATIRIATGKDVKLLGEAFWGGTAELVELIGLDVIDERAGPLTIEMTPSCEAFVRVSVMLFPLTCTTQRLPDGSKASPPAG